MHSWSQQEEGRLKARSKCLYACVLLMCVVMVGLGVIYDQLALLVAGLALSGVLCVQSTCVWYFSPRKGRVSTCPPSTL